MGHHGKNPIQVQEELALPNATTVNSTAWQYKGPTNYAQILQVYANTDIDIASGQALSIEFVTGATNTPSGALVPATHTYLLHKTATDAAIDLAAGDLICEFALPDGLMTEDYYYRLEIVSDYDESSEKIDVLLVGKV